jgi:hypothetical protein
VIGPAPDVARFLPVEAAGRKSVRAQEDAVPGRLVEIEAIAAIPA